LAFYEIPDNAFKTDLELFDLILYGNKIKRIGKSAFTPLTNLVTLNMNNNNVSEIDSNGLTFNLSNKSHKSNLTVYLSYNNFMKTGPIVNLEVVLLVMKSTQTKLRNYPKKCLSQFRYLRPLSI
jgi:Leucine-rich repeat (LRR) protein